MQGEGARRGARRAKDGMIRGRERCGSGLPLPLRRLDRGGRAQRLCVLALLCVALGPGAPAAGAAAPPASRADRAFAARAERLGRDYLRETGAAEPTPLAVEALGTFLAAKELYDAGRYADCRARLDALWARRPRGSAETWGGDDWPAGYVALQMLSECARARTAADWFQGRPEPWRLTAVMIGRTAGTNLVAGDLDALGNARFAEREARRATAFFGEYIRAISKGRLQLETRVVALKDWAPAGFKEGDSFVLAVEAALPPEVRRTTDCWWMMANNLSPAAGFWGGTLVEADGRQHFLDGDEWVRANDRRKGPPSDPEYWIGFSGWLLHEFYHYFLHAFPEFELEAVDHQWWYRDRWPADFEGYYETDYFVEALHKRIQAKADPPIHVRLKYRPPEDAAAGAAQTEDARDP